MAGMQGAERRAHICCIYILLCIPGLGTGNGLGVAGTSFSAEVAWGMDTRAVCCIFGRFPRSILDIQPTSSFKHLHNSPLLSRATLSSPVASSTPPPARSTSPFPLPSTCPSGIACTPGCRDPLSFAFLTFFCAGAGGYAFCSMACHSLLAWNSAWMGASSSSSAAVTAGFSSWGVSTSEA